MNGHAVG
jgi:hypothetical protein